jgi:2-polyprenyl-6-methoxyphenol hydroxylase-like FAD-dependent oxidoreductase
MNMGLGDAYDIGWKLAAIVNGWGGEELLQSYTIERRHVALRNVDRSGVFMSVHWKTSELTNELGHDQILTTTKEAEETKAKIREHVLANDGENKHKARQPCTSRILARRKDKHARLVWARIHNF